MNDIQRPSKEQRFDYHVEGTRILWDFPGGIGERAATLPELYLWSQIEDLQKKLDESEATALRWKQTCQRMSAGHEPAAAPHSADHLTRFTRWLADEMPAGTVIGDPAWWARKLLAAACVFADEAPDSWQPIETAPSVDGSECIVAAPGWYPKHNHCLVGEAKLHDGRWYWAQLDPSDSEPIHPTHWMPLPAPPPSYSTATKEGEHGR